MNALTPLRSQLIRSHVRFNSTKASSTNPISTWDEYFKLRKKRRNYEVAAYLPSTVIPSMGAMGYFLFMEISPVDTIAGMDPMMAMIAGTAAAGFSGFLMGPFVGTSLFKLFNRNLSNAMDARDKILYDHIKKNRAEASLNSFRNPVPDYYGEKINSVHDYRAWLRKQREHHRKGVFGSE
ncbi:mitochondrial import protein Pam17 [Pilobolus umbonatus]|nr:mitochondrial import protein Pam17 [Pilobolus umbonatus]